MRHPGALRLLPPPLPTSQRPRPHQYHSPTPRLGLLLLFPPHFVYVLSQRIPQHNMAAASSFLTHTLLGSLKATGGSTSLAPNSRLPLSTLLLLRVEVKAVAVSELKSF
ncbi:hypothetical protein E2C01_018589 [Portunus trituberculatus]|uniref:Uncharacterized protein n=1 Tax=Portunus trituberculatus TaxID=210409 RepID=A0A5B7DUU9_PORTR|nr:hypothetical protein [Portunus trituberculatus]